MKNALMIVLFLLMFEVSFGQALTSINEGFEADTIPAGWVVKDKGTNPGTWISDNYFAFQGERHVAIDTYDDAGGPAEDYLITPMIKVTEDGTIRLYAASGNEDYKDGFKILASSTDTAAASFTITVADVAEVPYDYTKFEYVLAENLDINIDDELYIAIYTNTNGSWLYVDEFRYGPKPVSTLDEGFEEGIPETWTILDEGHNPGTWFGDNYLPHSGEGHVSVDCYESDSASSGQADDYLITPALLVSEGDGVSFWAYSDHDTYVDGFQLLVSKTGTDVEDFIDTIAKVPEVPNEYTKYEYILTEYADISAGDVIYLAIRCNTNGSWFYADDFFFGPKLVEEIDEGFENGIPDTWTVIDKGNNPGTWMADNYLSHTGAGHVSVDCYESDSTNSGQADDYLITPLVSISDGDGISFWAYSDNDTYFDGFQLLVSKTGTETEDFIDTIAEVTEVPNAYTKYEYVLTDHANVSAGDKIYIAIRCNTNGSWLFIDDLKVGELVKDEILFEDFEEGIPDTWTIIDEGTNDEFTGTWTIDSVGGIDESFTAFLDTYSETGGAADDWLITPKFEIVDGYIFSFWASANESYPDTMDVMASLAGAEKADFTVTLLSNEVIPGDFTKYQLILSDTENISAGDMVHIAFHCSSNGSRLFIDNVRYGKYLPPKFNKVFTTGDESLTVEFDISVDIDSLSVEDFVLSGTESITFSSLTPDESNDKIVYLDGASQSMTGDNILDVLVNTAQGDSISFYAGILPISYLSLTNPDGTIDIEENAATFKGIIMAINGLEDRVWISDGAAPHHGVNAYGEGFVESIGDLGDEILLYGYMSPYLAQTEIYPATLVETVSTGNDLYDPIIISGSDINSSIPAESDPGEKYEGLLAKIEAATVVSYDIVDNLFVCSDDGETTQFIVGDMFRLFDGIIDETLLEKGKTYDITGFVVGRDSTFRIVPRNADDIVETVSVDPLEELSGVLVYPNPVVDQLKLKNTTDIESVKIINSLGRLIKEVKNEGSKSISVDLSDLKSGSYIIKLRSTDHKLFYHTLIKR